MSVMGTHRTATGARHTTALVALLALLALLAPAAAVVTAESASAGPAVAGVAAATAKKGTVRGLVRGPQPGQPKVTMRWFTAGWQFLGERNVNGGIYSLTLPRGTYHLQFVDRRPAYDVKKYAPTDVKVKIGAKTRQKNIRMRRGAAITGTVRAGGQRAAGARVVAANKYEQSFSVEANKKGQFAIGGLPPGSYSVFTYDRKKHWVGKSAWVPGLKPGRAKNIGIKLGTRAGRMLTDLFLPGGKRVTKRVTVTAVSKATGQFWTARSRGGSVTFAGLYPGRYTLVAPGVGNYLPRTGPVKNGRVRAGGADLASSFTWTKRGAWLTGRVVDKAAPKTALADVQVLLFDRSGQQLDSATTGKSGRFRLDGQLTTQQGLTVVAQPAGDNPPYLQGANYCKFAKTQRTGVSVRTGKERKLSTIRLPRMRKSEQPPGDCRG